jgi:hypothetical protein
MNSKVDEIIATLSSATFVPPAIRSMLVWTGNVLSALNRILTSHRTTASSADMSASMSRVSHKPRNTASHVAPVTASFRAVKLNDGDVTDIRWELTSEPKNKMIFSRRRGAAVFDIDDKGDSSIGTQPKNDIIVGLER